MVNLFTDNEYDHENYALSGKDTINQPIVTIIVSLKPPGWPTSESTKHCHVSDLVSFSQQPSRQVGHLSPHFADKQTVAQRGEETCLRSHSYKIAGLGLESCSWKSESVLLLLH